MSRTLYIIFVAGVLITVFSPILVAIGSWPTLLLASFFAILLVGKN